MPLSRSRVWKQFLWLAIVILVIGGGIWFWFYSHIGCDDDVQTTPISGSQWIVLTKIDRCSAIDGVVTISALNKVTNAETEIASLGEESVPTIKVISPKEVQLTFENLVDIVSSRNSFGNVRVVYKFVPRNDPMARREYQFWVHHPNDPRAIRWSKEHFKTGH